MNYSPCSHCGSTDIYTKPKTPHIGLYCRACGKWIKWLPQEKTIDTMPFGKHKGVAITELPDNYLDWLLTSCELKGSLRTSLEAEFERRGK